MAALVHDLTGQRFGKLVVFNHVTGSRQSRGKWRCHCDCGSTILAMPDNLKRGRTLSCGCARHGKPASNFTDLTGKVFGRLTVMAASGKTPSGQVLWRCACECSGETDTTSTKLKTGHTTSCGCFKNEALAERARKDGLFVGGKRHALFDTYNNMVARCYNDRDAAFEQYGGRGITVCDRWRFGEGGKTGFALFIKDMGPRPSSRHSIDRENNDGNYQPGNCRWATKTQQARNRRSNHLVDCDGQKVALSEYCERKGLRFNLINQRIGRGWSLERAVSQKPRGEAALSC